ncbi:MAG: TVP38/TMEM64 family protein [Gammaproteobacteria bacterium]|nr:TVP38/TMEM64 family protein [Gammaproteobacteria bacterium]
MTDIPPSSQRQLKFKQFIPLLVLIIALILFFASGLHRYFTFSELKSHHEALHHWKDQHYLLAVGSYMIIYMIAVAVSIPGATLLTLIGGFLFGHWFGTIYVVISATLGSAVIFIAAKSAFATMLETKAGPKINLLKKGFHENAMSYRHCQV